jgi:N-glycosylase/DNA lyase
MNSGGNECPPSGAEGSAKASAQERLNPLRCTAFAVSDYDLAETLMSGQSFRWSLERGAWSGVIGSHWVRLHSDGSRLSAETASPVCDWDWLATYLQIGVDLNSILAAFPDDDPMRAAVSACRGLRVLRQDPWECLASFILSSTKQIVQIRQIVALLCERFGEPLAVPAGYAPAFAFPTAACLARGSEAELRACRMGFRAPYLLATAREIAEGRVDLDSLRRFELPEARAALIQLPGVGRKIADCVLLFAYGLPTAFPVDVWVMRALRNLYFRGRKVTPKRLRHFSETHFGPHSGYAQQYLFHYIRTRLK